MRDLAAIPFTANTLDESDETHRRLLGDLYDPRYKWPIISPGIVDMRLFERSTMVRIAAPDDDDDAPDDDKAPPPDPMRPPARKLSELMKRDSGTSVYSFIVRALGRLRRAPD